MVVQEYFLKENISGSLLDKITGMQCCHGMVLGCDHCYVMTFFSKIPSTSYIRDQDSKSQFYFLAPERFQSVNINFIEWVPGIYVSRERSFPTLL